MAENKVARFLWPTVYIRFQGLSGQLSLDCHVRPCEANARLAKEMCGKAWVMARGKRSYVRGRALGWGHLCVGEGRLCERNYGDGVFVGRGFCPECLLQMSVVQSTFICHCANF